MAELSLVVTLLLERDAILALTGLKVTVFVGASMTRKSVCRPAALDVVVTA